ncbi:MAG: deoxynucleoside kinase [Bacteroidales bacterium]|jgi:deoxyadenosine/deoxycytidine kinase|nr:deoxynucleoside kinase [Bacteroidales bacterium]
MKYNFIAIEGNIGAGKTSLATMISEEYNAKLILEQFEDNAFLPMFYKDPEKYAFPLEMSFLASRYQQLTDQLGTQDLFKSFTISDYYIVKSLIFAQKTLPPAELSLYTRFFNIINKQLPKPELFVYLYVKTPKLQQNIKLRGRSYEQEIQDDYLDKIQEGYFDFIKQQTQLTTLILDTNSLDFVRNRTDYDKIIDVMHQTYKPGIHRITF